MENQLTSTSSVVRSDAHQEAFLHAVAKRIDSVMGVPNLIPMAVIIPDTTNLFRSAILKHLGEEEYQHWNCRRCLQFVHDFGAIILIDREAEDNVIQFAMWTGEEYDSLDDDNQWKWVIHEMNTELTQRVIPNRVAQFKTLSAVFSEKTTLKYAECCPNKELGWTHFYVLPHTSRFIGHQITTNLHDNVVEAVQSNFSYRFYGDGTTLTDIVGRLGKLTGHAHLYQTVSRHMVVEEEITFAKKHGFSQNIVQFVSAWAMLSDFKTRPNGRPSGIVLGKHIQLNSTTVGNFIENYKQNGLDHALRIYSGQTNSITYLGSDKASDEVLKQADAFFTERGFNDSIRQRMVQLDEVLDVLPLRWSKPDADEREAPITPFAKLANPKTATCPVFTNPIATKMVTLDDFLGIIQTAQRVRLSPTSSIRFGGGNYVTTANDDAPSLLAWAVEGKSTSRYSWTIRAKATIHTGELLAVVPDLKHYHTGQDHRYRQTGFVVDQPVAVMTHNPLHHELLPEEFHTFRRAIELINQQEDYVISTEMDHQVIFLSEEQIKRNQGSVMFDLLDVDGDTICYKLI